MSTVFVRGVHRGIADELHSNASSISLDEQAEALLKPPEKRSNGPSVPEPHSPIEPLGLPHNEKRFWFQRGQDYDPYAIATQVIMRPGPFYLALFE